MNPSQPLTHLSFFCQPQDTSSGVNAMSSLLDRIEKNLQKRYTEGPEVNDSDSDESFNERLAKGGSAMTHQSLSSAQRQYASQFKGAVPLASILASSAANTVAPNQYTSGVPTRPAPQKPPVGNSMGPSSAANMFSPVQQPSKMNGYGSVKKGDLPVQAQSMRPSAQYQRQQSSASTDKNVTKPGRDGKPKLSYLAKPSHTQSRFHDAFSRQQSQEEYAQPPPSGGLYQQLQSPVYQQQQRYSEVARPAFPTRK